LIFWFSLAVALAGFGCATPQSASLQRFEYQRPEMGLPFRIVLYAPDSSTATNAAEAAFARISDLNGIMSDYEENSELSRLSHTSGIGTNVPVSPDLWRVLAKAQEISAASGGAFDVTVGPLVQLWKRARRQRQLPEPDRVQAALVSSGWTNMILDSNHHTVRLIRPGMRLDLGGIAKGYALDEAAKILAKRGINRALVSGGGDMAAGDPPPGAKGWKVEVGLIDITNAPPPRFVWIRNTGLTTSGDTFQRVEIGGVRYSHIVDPHTGFGLTNHCVVTVIRHDAFTADALTKAMSILPVDRAQALARSYNAEVLSLRASSAGVDTDETPGFSRWSKE
jgi:thiamine biosynthesis lipoprotein